MPSSTGSPATVRSAGTPSATSSSSPCWELHEDPVAGLDLVARLLRPRAACSPWPPSPLTIEADVSHLDPDDPTASAS